MFYKNSVYFTILFAVYIDFICKKSIKIDLFLIFIDFFNIYSKNT
jgi:hypothetical protein